MNRLFLVGLGVLAACVTVSVFALEQQTSTAHVAPAVMAAQFIGGGHWQSQSRIASLSDQTIGSLGAGWQLQVKQMDDNSLTGRITIVGSPRIQQARIEGQISGSAVDGVLVDNADTQIGTFTGSVSNGSVSGTYTTADGDTGTWSWDGPLPGATAAMPVLVDPPVPVSDQPATVDGVTSIDPFAESPVSQ